ncbi:zf-HC2 domain-containing protein [Mycobacterium sp.]|jgi:anti-sigma factor RsiW|uniref:anti-sigma factor family protein n=1 Tax=Mycobacterium sp. TaxID=1785 RepID=UPI0033425B8A|nr:rane protein [Mycobacterium sp.]
MTPLRPSSALSQVGGTDPYALWDAAYVLGSLSSADGREFAAHLGGCPSCRASVGEFRGIPGLLGQLTRNDVAAIDEGGWSAPPPLSPRLLTSLLARKR